MVPAQGNGSNHSSLMGMMGPSLGTKEKYICSPTGLHKYKVRIPTPSFTIVAQLASCTFIKTGLQLLVLNEQGPQEKGNVMFRYDPAIVVVSLNWHEKRSNISEDIHRKLMTKYVDHEERVGSPFHLHKDYVTLTLSICNRLFWSSSRWTGRAGNTIQSSTAARCTRWRASLPCIPRLRCSSS